MVPGPPLYGAVPCALTGTVIGGRYEILGSLARGGMAEVFLAKQGGIDGFEKLVAVKTIAGRGADDEYFVAMFLDEARTAADLRHPNVVQTFEVGVDADTYFIAMEFLQGASLARLMKELEKRGAAVPYDVAVQVAREAAAGLHHAHVKTDLQGKPLGIVHRDVSPQNIIVTVDGVTKIVDFGIALASKRSIVTSTGGLKGKYPYMSPEQAEGLDVDGRTDLFALGVILWEMTLGRPLFRGATEAKTLDAVRACDPPRPTSVLRDYPRPLEDVVMRLLAKDAAARPKSGAEVVALLEGVESRLGFSPRASKLQQFVERTLDERAHDLAALAEAKTESGGAPRVAVVSPAAPGAETVTFLAKRRRARLFLAAAGVVVAAVVALAVALPEGKAEPPAAPGSPPPFSGAGPGVGGPTPPPPPAPAAPALVATAAPPTPAAPAVVAAPAPRHAARRHPRPPVTAPPSKPAPAPPAAVTAAGEGTLAFPDADPYFVVHVDGVTVGPSPILRYRVAAGAHRVQLLQPDSAAVVLDTTVDVHDGDVRRVTAPRR